MHIRPHVDTLSDPQLCHATDPSYSLHPYIRYLHTPSHTHTPAADTISYKLIDAALAHGNAERNELREKLSSSNHEWFPRNDMAEFAHVLGAAAFENVGYLFDLAGVVMASICSSCKEVRSENALYGLCSTVAVDVDAGQHYTSPMDPALLHNSVMAPSDSNVCKGANTERDAVPTRLPRLWVAQVTTIVVCYCKILHYFCTYNTSMHRCVVRFMKVNIVAVLTGMYPDTVLLIVTNAKLFNAISRT